MRENDKKSEDEINSLKNMLETYITKCKALTISNETLGENLKTITKRISSIQDEIQDKERAVREKDALVQELNKKLSFIDFDYKKLMQEDENVYTRKIGSLEAENKKAKDEIAELKRKLDDEVGMLKVKGKKEMEILEEKVKKAVEGRDGIIRYGMIFD